MSKTLFGNDMKIALCFSGQPRSFRQGYDFYKKNLLDHYDVDVIFHSWNTADNQAYLDLYKPVLYKFDGPVTANLDKYTRRESEIKHPKFNTYAMYYTMNECKKLLASTTTEYNWVIRSRTDYALNVKINFETLDNSKIYLPDDYIAPNRDIGNDQFAFGSKDAMIKYMSTFENMDRYYDEGTIFNGEDMMGANLRYHSLCGTNLEYINMNNPFHGGPYNGGSHCLIREDFLKWNPGVTVW
jgi:hypothetical protein